MNFSSFRIALVSTSMMVGLAKPAPVLAQEHDNDDGPAKPLTEIIVTSKRLDAARANIEPSLGASTYTLSNEAVESRPSGETTTVGQILLQAPGVVQGGSGQLHVRGSQGNLQYRINNVILPEGLSDLGESLSPRIADKVQLVTGALPAQYGLQAGGVVNITTKNGVYLDGGQAELYAGGQNSVEPAIEFGGSRGNTNLFVSGRYQRNNTGIPAPDGSVRPLHDRTEQAEGFAFLDHIVDAQTRVSLILGTSDEHFELPNLRGLDAATYMSPKATYRSPLTFGGVSSFPSEARGGRRRDVTRYAIASVLRSTDKATLQASAFARYSARSVRADGLGDLLFTGAAQTTDDSNTAFGIQVEGVYELAEAHSVRGGVVFSSDLAKGNALLRTLPVDPVGRQTSDVPKLFADASRVRGQRLGVFLQDEWRPIDGVTVNLGLRFDSIDAVRRDSAFSPRVGIVWAGSGGVTAHAGYARYFLPAPVEGAGERASDLVGTTAAAPSLRGDALLPETDDYYDVGIARSLGALTLGIDAYWRQAQNLIDEGQFGPAAITRSFNYSRGRIRGVELTATYTAGRVLAWTNAALAEGHGQGIASNQYYFTPAQLAYLSANAIPLTQSQTLTLSGGTSYSQGPLRLSGDFLYGSGLRRTKVGGTPNGEHLPAYTQINLAAVYRVATIRQRPLDVRIDILNAFDARYRLRDDSAIGDGTQQWAARRGVFIGLEQAF